MWQPKVGRHVTLFEGGRARCSRVDSVTDSATLNLSIKKSDGTRQTFTGVPKATAYPPVPRNNVWVAQQ